MRASEQEGTGGAGASQAAANFELINWGPVPNSAHDLGTDLLVQARDKRRYDLGLIIGVQVKAGKSAFKEASVDADGNVVGWWYYEAGVEHFDDWVTHGLPHVLVLQDLATNTSYWVHVTAERVEGTGKGCKILVPRNQTIDDDHLDDLLAVATAQRAAPSLEGTAFAASADAVPPGRRLRYALLAPRLVAPHRNRGFDTPLTPEEGLALCAQGRFLDLHQFSERHADKVPIPAHPYDGTDWRWSFVRAVYVWALHGKVDDLSRAVKSAPSPHARAAAGVFYACSLHRRERLGDGIKVLTELIDEDRLAPVDQGWVLVQRSRLRAEIGEVEAARADASDAQRHFQADIDDVTVSALAAAAAWQLFTTADFLRGDLGRVMTATDTAVAWWRTQTVSSALSEASDRRFREWAEDRSMRWVAEDALANNLFAAELNADLTGEHGSWRALAAASAQQDLMGWSKGDATDEVADALDRLRRSGNDATLKLALLHLRRSGPLEALVESVCRIGFDWTHTSAKCNLTFVELCGDLLAEERAGEWVDFLLHHYSDDGAGALVKLRPAFLTNLAFAEAIGGLLPAASTEHRQRVRELLAGAPHPIDDVLLGPLRRWVRYLPYDAASPSVKGLLSLGMSDQRALGSALLGWLASNGNEDAKGEVHRRVLSGDLAALGEMEDIRVLSDAHARSVIERFDSMTQGIVRFAERGGRGMGGFDPGQGLALFNVWFPHLAHWDPLLELLTHPKVAGADKRGALRLLVQISGMVPDEVQARLRSSIDALRVPSPLSEPGESGVGGLGSELGIVTGAIDGETADVAVAQLALGSHEERCDAAHLIGLGWCPGMRALLASFLADTRTDVRVAAARAVGTLASSDPSPFVVALTKKLVDDPGTAVPPALLSGLSRGGAASELGREVAETLAQHPSARVREMARSFLQR